jgi:TolB protein
MKRFLTYWQMMVLLLVFLAMVGVYGMLAVLWDRMDSGGAPAGPGGPAATGGGVQILEPLDGAVLPRAPRIALRAALSGPGFTQAELEVDGVAVGAVANPEPSAATWLAEWAWADAAEGSHLLVVAARDAGGGQVASPPVTVTLVPPGRLAFASNRDGVPAIYAMGTDGRDVRRLSQGPGEARQPSWSGEGALAFVAEAADGPATVQVLAAGADQPQDLFAGRDPAWSPDGQRLAYAASVEGVSQVFVAGVEGGAPAPVTAEEVYAGQPAWSPDGTQLAYVARREGNWDVWVTALAGGAPRQLTEDPGTDWGPAWSPDGTRLAFVSDRAGSHQIYAMAADGSDVRRLTDLSQGAEAPAWSPDGYWLAFVAYGDEGPGADAREIYLMRADGQEVVRLTHNAYDDGEPDWGGE